MCRLFVGANPILWESQTRSFRLEGMVTSVRLENLFWLVLDDIAAKDGLNVPQLLHQLYTESIEEGHDLGNFTSFLRVCCLRFLNLQVEGLVPANKTVGLENLSADGILAIEADRRKDRMANSSFRVEQH